MKRVIRCQFIDGNAENYTARRSFCQEIDLTEDPEKQTSGRSPTNDNKENKLDVSQTIRCYRNPSGTVECKFVTTEPSSFSTDKTTPPVVSNKCKPTSSVNVTDTIRCTQSAEGMVKCSLITTEPETTVDRLSSNSGKPCKIVPSLDTAQTIRCIHTKNGVECHFEVTVTPTKNLPLRLGDDKERDVTVGPLKKPCVQSDFGKGPVIKCTWLPKLTRKGRIEWKSVCFEVPSSNIDEEQEDDNNEEGGGDLEGNEDPALDTNLQEDFQVQNTKCKVGTLNVSDTIQCRSRVQDFGTGIMMIYECRKMMDDPSAVAVSFSSPLAHRKCGRGTLNSKDTIVCRRNE
jgi:hypothetical protein